MNSHNNCLGHYSSESRLPKPRPRRVYLNVKVTFLHIYFVVYTWDIYRLQYERDEWRTCHVRVQCGVMVSWLDSASGGMGLIPSAVIFTHHSSSSFMRHWFDPEQRCTSGSAGDLKQCNRRSFACIHVVAFRSAIQALKLKTWQIITRLEIILYYSARVVILDRSLKRVVTVQNM